ncbi:MAG: bacterioferritin [Elusimicrobia bacterium]|nr:bacterioferritin [Elusimicrobiota bacterium]
MSRIRGGNNFVQLRAADRPVRAPRAKADIIAALDGQGARANAAALAPGGLLLADELTAINQYMVHSEMCANWGYQKLHKQFEKRAITEMKHAEKLIGRILFLEGTPTVSVLRKMNIGADVPKQLAGDHALEAGAIKSYNEAIVQAGEAGDYATRDILQAILNDEDGHIDEIEELQDQVGQMTLPVFLSTQVKE